MKLNKKIIITGIFFIIIFYTDLYAIGEIGVGVNIGFTHDPNNLEEDIAEYNTNIELYKTSNPGTKVEQLNVPYVPVFGVNFRYNFNYLLFRIGGHYSRALFFKTKGFMRTPGGVKNTIKIDSYQASFPGSIGLLVPLKKRAYAYIGGGMNLHFAYVSIEQSNSGYSIVNPDDRKNRYSGMFGGFHIIFGIEFPITRRYTISGEWIHQMGTSPMIKSKDGSNEISIKINSDILLFGINYYIPI